jgi:hypothetical protein
VLGEPPVLPYWLESHHRDQIVLDFHGELDGSWIAIAGNTVFLIDRDHHVELGLDFDWFHLTDPRPGDEGTTMIVEAHRVGSRIVAYAADPQAGPFLASIDIATGRSVWAEQIQANSVAGFAVARGYVITSEPTRDEGVQLVVRELAAGRIIATVPTKDGPYSLEATTDNHIHGVVEALAEDGFTSQIDIDVQ